MGQVTRHRGLPRLVNARNVAGSGRDRKKTVAFSPPCLLAGQGALRAVRAIAPAPPAAPPTPTSRWVSISFDAATTASVRPAVRFGPSQALQPLSRFLTRPSSLRRLSRWRQSCHRCHADDERPQNANDTRTEPSRAAWAPRIARREIWVGPIDAPESKIHLASVTSGPTDSMAGSSE